MTTEAEIKFTRVTCPRCQRHNTRQIPMQPGYDKKLKHYICDDCRIGWYQFGKGSGRLYGDPKLAKQAYVPLPKKSRK